MTQNTIWRPPISHQATILFLFLSLLYLGDLVNPLVADMSTTCFGEGAKFCKNETLTARSLTVGNATLRAYQSHRAQTAALDPVVSCCWLPTPRNRKKNGTRYPEGNTLSFTCIEGHILYGSTTRTCLDVGSWPGQQPYCIKDDNVGIVLGAVGSLSALVTMGVMMKLHYRKQEREKKEKLDHMVVQKQTC